ncbi:response regulator [Parasphingorhabdus pacifica]
MNRIRLLIVDDEPLVRQGIRSVFDPFADVEVAGEATEGAEAVRAVRELSPEVVLMDLHLPGMGGLEATERICSGGDQCAKVVVLTMYDRDEHVFEALRAGASGFLLKDASPAKLVEAVREVARGEALLSASVTRRLIREFVRVPAVSGAGADCGMGDLTYREREVFRLLAKGNGNRDIARLLVVEESTVKSHVQHLYQKLGVRDRVQLVIYAYERGLV